MTPIVSNIILNNLKKLSDNDVKINKKFIFIVVENPC
jgi:hypothetical protein